MAAGVRRRGAGDRPDHLAGRVRPVREQGLRGLVPGRRQRPPPGRRLGGDPLHALPAGRPRPHPPRLPAHAAESLVLQLSRSDNGQGRPPLARGPGLLRALRGLGVAAARPGVRLRPRRRRGPDRPAHAGRRPPAARRPLLANLGPGHVPRLPRPRLHSRRTRLPGGRGPVFAPPLRPGVLLVRPRRAGRRPAADPGGAGDRRPVPRPVPFAVRLSAARRPETRTAERRPGGERPAAGPRTDRRRDLRLRLLRFGGAPRRRLHPPGRRLFPLGRIVAPPLDGWAARGVPDRAWR